MQNIYFFKVLSSMFLHICDLLLPLKRRFPDSQIVILPNFVVVSSVGINRVVCTLTEKHLLKEEWKQKGLKYYGGSFLSARNILI